MKGLGERVDHILVHAFSIFMGFFAIMNPIANVPIFLSLTSEDDSATTAAIAFKSLSLAFIIVAIFSLAGKTIFSVFGITLPAFQITGGLLVFFIGAHMLQGGQSSIQTPSDEDKADARAAALSVAVSPLAMPILAGPGTIVTAMNFTANGGAFEIILTIIIFAVLCVISYALFMFGEKFVQYIGASALGVVTRLMGLILAVIGTQMVINGMHGAFKLSA